MKRSLSLWLFVISLKVLMALSLWNCNFSTTEEVFFLKVTVNDSLSVEAGKYDTLEIDLLDTNGNMLQKHLFNAPYFLADSSQLAKLPLLAAPPANFIVRITAHDKVSGDAWVLTSKVVNGAPQPLTISHKPDTSTSSAGPTRVTLVSPKGMPLYVGDTVSVAATLDKADNSIALVWSSSNPLIAMLTTEGKLVALTPGAFTLKVAHPSNAALFDTTAMNVLAKPTALPESISILTQNPLVLTVGETSEALNAKVLPSTANQNVVWTLPSTDLASLESGNRIKAIKQGTLKVTVTSTIASTVFAVLDVSILPVPAKAPDSITLDRKSLKLYTGGTDGQITVTLHGGDSASRYALSSSDATIATVNASGLIKALKPGIALIRATVVGFPNLSSQCSVTVVTDTPVVSISPDQTVAYGGEAIFKVSVTQANGTVAEIKADMDGNGAFEQTLLGVDTATFRATYSEVKIYDLNFQVKDSEGNVVLVSRKVTVSPPAVPTVRIIDPALAIIVNTLTYTIKFTVKDPTKAADESKDSVVTLTDGPNTIRVARTNVGGTGSAQVVITLNRTAPGTPVFVAQPAITADNTPTWSWGAVAGAAKYQVRLDDPDYTKATGTLDVTTLSYTPAALVDGLHTLYVRSLDTLGNASSPASQAVTVDTRPPAAVSFTGIDSSYTASSTPTWTWTPSATNAGTGVYVLKLGSGAEFDWTTTSFTPTTALSDNAYHTLTVKEKDQVPGVSGAAKSFTYRVKVNPPSAPNVRSAANVANNGLTNNPGFTWTSGGGGNGRYRVRINSETTYRVNGVAQTSWSVPVAEADGIYTVRVSEQDDMGRWGPEGNFAVQLDRTGPVYTEVRILGSTFDLRDGFITNVASVVISYKSDAATKQFSCNLSLDNASNTCSVVNTDAAGNSSTLLRNIWRRSNVIFFTTTGQGAKDGSSWENARGDLVDFVNSTTGPGIDGKDLWIGSGDYSASNINMQGKWCKFFGGFNAAAFPTSLSGRINFSTTLGSVSLFVSDSCAFDGLTIKGLSTMTGHITFTNCRFTSSITLNMSSDINFVGSEAIGIDGLNEPAFKVAYSDVVWSGGRIADNNPIGSNYPIEITGGLLTLKGNLTVSGNANSNLGSIQIKNQDQLIIESSVTINCNSIFNDGGTGSCKGSTL